MNAHCRVVTIARACQLVLIALLMNCDWRSAR